MDLNNLLAEVQNNAQNTATGLGGIDGIISGIQNEAIKAALQKYWPIIVGGGVSALILVLAAPLAGTYVESKLIRKIAGAGIDEVKKKEKKVNETPETNNNDNEWVRLRIKDPSTFIQDTYRTKKINDDVHLILATPKNGGKPQAQSMRFKGIETFKDSIPEIEKQHKAKVYEKEPGEYGLQFQKEPPKRKKLKLPGKNILNQNKPGKNKKEKKQPSKTAQSPKEILKSYNPDIKPGDKVKYNLRGKEHEGTIIKRSENQMSFEIKNNEGQTVKVPTTLVKEV